MGNLVRTYMVNAGLSFSDKRQEGRNIGLIMVREVIYSRPKPRIEGASMEVFQLVPELDLRVISLQTGESRRIFGEEVEVFVSDHEHQIQYHHPFDMYKVRIVFKAEPYINYRKAYYRDYVGIIRQILHGSHTS